jgi:hypothetical protein
MMWGGRRICLKRADRDAARGGAGCEQPSISERSDAGIHKGPAWREAVKRVTKNHIVISMT